MRLKLLRYTKTTGTYWLLCVDINLSYRLIIIA